MICLEAYRKQNPFFLAPMAGVTDKPFRSFMREMGCGIMTSELVSARALQDNNQRTYQLMEFSEDQRPYGIQIFGEDPFAIEEGAKRAENFGADFIDLNLGCPVNKIVKKGAGSALLKDLKVLSKVLHSLKKSVSIPVSLKIRTGWDEQSRNANQVAYMAYEEGFSWMSIHGRTRSQAYSGQVDWNYIREIKFQSSIPIIGNGDLISGLKAFEALQFSGCDGVMIGRGCLNDPWIFLEALHFLKQQEQKTSDRGGSERDMLAHNTCCFKKNANQDKFLKNGKADRDERCFKKDFKAAMDKLRVHLENFYDERMFLLQLKKFTSWFSSGFPHSGEFRRKLFQEKDKQNLIQKIDEFFTQVEDYKKPVPVYEPFLMRGHG